MTSPHITPLFPGPVSAGFVDHLIWNIGLGIFPNNERSFLRGIHHRVSLEALLAHLSSHRPGEAIRLTSTWVDRHPQAHPVLAAFKCELGDLLVIWRLLDLQGNEIRRVGWMLQAKMADDPAIMGHRDPSSLNEYALYEKGLNWDFDVHHHAQHLGRFNLASDADLNPGMVLPSNVVHWNYLQIRRPRSRSAALWPTPLQWRWASSGAAHLFGGLAMGIASMMEAVPQRGAELHARNTEWTRLCDALLAFTAGRNSRLANGAWQLTCMALVPEEWDSPELAHHLARERMINSDTPPLTPVWIGHVPGFGVFTSGPIDPSAPDGESAGSDSEAGGFGIVMVDSVQRGDGQQNTE